MAGIACNNHRGGTRRRCPGADTVDFSWFASINGLVSGSGIVGRDVRVVEVGLAELIIGNHGNGTEAPLPSRNDGMYMRIGLDMRIGLEDSVDDSVDEGCGSLSFCTVAPDGNFIPPAQQNQPQVEAMQDPSRGNQPTSNPMGAGLACCAS